MSTDSGRSKRLLQLGGLVVVAAVVVVLAIVLSGGGSTKSGGGLNGAPATQRLFAGIPQHGLTMGNPKAPVSIIEFADPQCPFCGAFSRDQMPTIVKRYVRTGKAKIELRLLTFLGPDSSSAAQALEGAGFQNKLWNAVDLFYANQGQENSGYVTDPFLRKVLGGVPGLDVAKAMAAMGTPAAQAQLGASNTLASQYAVTGTPTFVVGRTGGTMTRHDNFTQAAQLSQAIDQALGVKVST